MGERAGYRLIAPDWPREGSPETKEKKGIAGILEPPDGPPRSSQVYRMQWYLGDTPSELKAITLALVNQLTSNGKEKVGSGMGALRADLKYDRLWPNFIVTLARLNASPYNSIHEDVNCDISDHGLFTLRVLRWDEWHWEWNPVKWNTPTLDGDPILLLRTTFEDGKDITDGGVRFHISLKGFNEAFGSGSEG